ncbi:diacylglycerol/lipid kinase family protein [Leucobacter denitrificans]|uniref:NAD(+)/NADH kinase n=1 Tax=Leucobacter denitrificans TaxID=683042 RepID=A0A7G9S2K7_9MICO|nr:diacylglycerol kinase family protein [Leucobacter denitrificans]QNN62082.1 NAD(+)/NADH kinase [Leucobacter denitrificans]
MTQGAPGAEQARSWPHAAVVYQPVKTQLSLLRSTVGRAEARAGWAPTRWYETEAHDSGTGAARQAIADGASVVLGAGGDGTIRAIAEGLGHTRVPLAIIPQGTGNLLARNLGVPLGDLAAAVEGAFFGRNRPIDLGRMTIVRPPDAEGIEREDEHAFLVLAGMGLDARTIRTTKSELKRRVGWLAYVDAGVRTMVKDRPLNIHYSVDGGPAHELTVYTVMIGNCGLLPGGVLLIPDAHIDDGLLDVVALTPLGPFSWLRIWNKIGWENGVLRKSKVGRRIIDLVNDTKSVNYLTARTYALSVPRPEPVQLDGDDFGLAIAVRGVVDPGALIVRVLPNWLPLI